MNPKDLVFFAVAAFLVIVSVTAMGLVVFVL